ncbi:MAG TPA: HAMP domain-containing sensor histidine kinase, partial [Polyangiaceae bacterium]|nr:HAMP domain-containing sensor histidine kinase [Polyangiaceae bacterium]
MSDELDSDSESRPLPERKRRRFRSSSLPAAPRPASEPLRTERLAWRMVTWVTLFTLVTALALYLVPPYLLLLRGESGRAAALALTWATLMAGALGGVQVWTLIQARRDVLESVADERGTLDQPALPKLNDDPWLIANAWVMFSTAAVCASMTVARPAVIPASTAMTLGIFASVLIAAASLPLLMLVRRDFLQVMERIPPEVMGDIIDAQVRGGRLRGRTSRRLLAAIVTPVAFLAIGSALIGSAHVRAMEESRREATARAVATAVLGGADAEAQVASARAQRALAALGYQSWWESDLADDAKTRPSLATLRVPLGDDTAYLNPPRSSAWPVSEGALALVLTALLLAGYVGVALAGLLSRDLRMANHGVRTLGTDAALEGTRVMRPARFRAVAELAGAIELLANRFRLFALAQERSIDARESATRARGRFFASVSHDLKSPLNAILGFAELTLREPTTNEAQSESLGLILQRGRELLALVETILDAARIEAGQLTLERSDEGLLDILQQAIAKATDLSQDSRTVAVVDAPEDLPRLPVDRLRLSQALATFIGHARRTAERDTLRVLVEVERKSERPTLARRRVTIFVEIPSARFSAQELEAMLSPERHPGQHRGLSMALRLAKSIVELHGGEVNITG